MQVVTVAILAQGTQKGDAYNAARSPFLRKFDSQRVLRSLGCPLVPGRSRQSFFRALVGSNQEVRSPAFVSFVGLRLLRSLSCPLVCGRSRLTCPF